MSASCSKRRMFMCIPRTLTNNVLSLLAVTLFAVPIVAAQSIKIDLSNEAVGAEPKSFLSVVGIWRIEQEGSKKVLAVDGRQWKEGQSSAGVADQARARCRPGAGRGEAGG